MSGEAFEKRRRAFEEEFFQKQSQKLVDKLRETLQKKQTREELEQITGIQDAGVLDTLMAMHLAKDTFAAFALYPLVEVAWADGTVDEKERKAFLAAAAEHGHRARQPRPRRARGVLEDHAERGHAQGLVRLGGGAQPQARRRGAQEGPRGAGPARAGRRRGERGHPRVWATRSRRTSSASSTPSRGRFRTELDPGRPAEYGGRGGPPCPTRSSRSTSIASTGKSCRGGCAPAMARWRRADARRLGSLAFRLPDGAAYTYLGRGEDGRRWCRATSRPTP